MTDNPSLDAWIELQKGHNGSLRALFLMVSMEIAGFAMCIPVLSFFAIKELGCSPRELGFIMSANAASQLLGSWTCGRLSDSFGRKWLLLGSFALSCVNISGTYFVDSILQLLILRTLGGLSGGTTPLCQAYILDWVGKDRRPSMIGLFGFLCGIAFLFGNLIGVSLLLIDVDRRPIFLVGGGFASCATLYGCFTLEESLDALSRRPLCYRDVALESDPAGKSDFEAIGVGLVCIWGTRFLQSLAGAVMFSTYAFLIDRLFGWSDVHLGMLMAAAAILYAFIQVAVYPLFGQHGKLGSASSAIVANICGVCGGFVLPIPVVSVHLFAIFLLIVTGGLFEPAVPVLVGIFVGESHVGFGNGVATSFRCAAQIIGPYFGGILFEQGVRFMCIAGSAIYCIGVLGSVGIAFSPHHSSEEDVQITKSIGATYKSTTKTNP